MKNLIKAKFYPEKKMKTKLYFKRISKMLVFLLLLNISLCCILIYSLLGFNIPVYSSKFKPNKTVDNSNIVTNHTLDSSNFKPLQYQSGYAGHSNISDSMNSIFNSKSLANHIRSKMDTSKIDITSRKSTLGYYGIDVSHWQNKINWDVVHKDTLPNKLKFYIIKATQGANYIDIYFNNNWNKAKSRDAIVGAYHFFQYKDDPIEQAKNYISTVKLIQGDFLPIIDIELDCSGCKKPEISKADLIKNLNIFISEIEKHYNAKPILYTFPYFYETYLKGDFDDYAYWISHFSKNAPKGMSIYNYEIIPDDPLIPIWQFSHSERIDGIIGNVNMSFLPTHYLDSILYK